MISSKAVLFARAAFCFKLKSKSMKLFKLIEKKMQPVGLLKFTKP